MTKPSLRFMRNEHIEDVTSRRIRQYEDKAQVQVTLPVPAEEIVEQVLCLNILWDTITEQPGEMILAGLVRRTRTIVMNETHLALFEGKPGLRNSTLVHEAGHADLEGELGDRGPSLFESESEPDRIVYRHSPKVTDRIAVLHQLALRNEQAYRLLRKLTQGQDTPEQKSAVDRYQNAFLLPKWLLAEAVGRYDVTRWPDLYALADEAQVNISNLVTRLVRLEMVFIPQGTKTIYRSKDQYTGQKSLFD